MTTDIKTFWQGRASVDGPRATRFHGEHDPYDMAAITGLAGAGARVLDLGCGTCEIANRLVTEHGMVVHAVDFVGEFLGNAVEDPRLTTERADAVAYVDDRTFDLIINLGVVTCIEHAWEREAMYRHCVDMLAPGGTLFVKAQFGVEEEVVVDTYSEALGSHYKAVYPQLDDEVARLSAAFDVTVEDPFPASFSPWGNTHFHYLVCRRKAS